MNDNKENIKINIQKIFTKLRNEINNREDQLMFKIEEKFNNIIFKETLIKEYEKFPNKINISLEKGKNIDKDWNDDNKLNMLINDCINIENNINEIKLLNENLIKYSSNKYNVNYNITDEYLNDFINKINMFGNVYNNYEFSECSKNVDENMKYNITGKMNNIVTKIGKNRKWIRILCKNKLEKNKMHKWKIKILNTKNKHIMIGVSPVLKDENFDYSNFIKKLNLPEYDENNIINKSKEASMGKKLSKALVTKTSIKIETKKEETNIAIPNNYGWFLYCLNSKLYSVKQQSKETNLEIKDEIDIIMNMELKTLNFMINDENNKISFNDIPIDNEITPAILLYDENDSIQITPI